MPDLQCHRGNNIGYFLISDVKGNVYKMFFLSVMFVTGFGKIN